MSDDEFEDQPENIFDRLTLSKVDLKRLEAARRRRDQDLRSLVGDAFFFRACLEGRSPRIDASARQGIRAFIDEIRLLIAARPAEDQHDLFPKLAALGLHDREPLVSANANLRTMIEASARNDIGRLKIAAPARWILDWSLT
jgi:hypothetical protein